MSDVKDYPARVFWSEEDGGFIAEAIDLPGCSAFGETQADAVAELADAAGAWIEAAEAAGNPIPQPTDFSVREKFSGKLNVRLPKSLHASLTHIAKQEGQSLNSQIVSSLTVFVATYGTSQFWTSSAVISEVSALPSLVSEPRIYQGSRLDCFKYLNTAGISPLLLTGKLHSPVGAAHFNTSAPLETAPRMTSEDAAHG